MLLVCFSYSCSISWIGFHNFLLSSVCVNLKFLAELLRIFLICIIFSLSSRSQYKIVNTMFYTVWIQLFDYIHCKVIKNNNVPTLRHVYGLPRVSEKYHISWWLQNTCQASLYKNNCTISLSSIYLSIALIKQTDINDWLIIF